MAKEFKATITNQRQAKQYFNHTLSDIQRFAIAGTANKVAFEGIIKTNKQFKKDFHLSNKFLVGSAPGKGLIKFNKAKPSHDINKIESEFGAPRKRGDTDLKFLVAQEFGFKHGGMVPTKWAYPHQQKKRVIKRNLARKGITIKGTRGFPRGKAATNQQRTLFFMRQMYLNNYALPGSKQFIYIRPSDQFFNFSEGMYQFSGGGLKGDAQFPHLKLIYATTDKVNKRRKPTNTFKKVSLQFTETEIGKIFEKEFNRSFTNQIKKLR